MKFKGFPPGKVSFTSIPSLFFTELLPQIENIHELKVTLYALWQVTRMEKTFKYLRERDFAEDAWFMRGMGVTSQAQLQALAEGLSQAVARGTFLRVATPPPEEEQHLYFFNSPQGRAAVKAIQEGNWRPGKDTSPNPSLSIERPNIFQLYEENIGPLTPLIADALRDAESIYSATWIEEAIAIAVKNNVRKWNYIEAILHSWKEEGRYERKDKRHSEKDSQTYLEDEFFKFTEH
ncbi:MAG: hypothetical protein DRI56_01475 [Chloroflexota bacterium]|nr:MAG: hypothetical protein DRI56_01475 [Chloroflexota bacterium]